MQRHPSARLALAALALALGLTVPPTAQAAAIWTLVGAPLTASTGVTTDIKLTATNESLLDVIGCVRVDTTSHFSVQRVDANHGWSASLNGTVVTAQSPDPGSTLALLDSVDITVRTTPLEPGTWSWSGTAYASITCGETPLDGVQVVVIVVTGAALTPTPTPAPTPTPTPALLPPPTLPIPTLPPLLTPTPTPAPTPTLAATPPQAATPTPAGASATPVGTGGDGTSPTGSASGAGTTDGGGGPAGPFTLSNRDVTIPDPPLGFGDASPTLLELSAPAIVIGLPGLLVLLAVAAQAAGGVTWMAVVRRQLGDSRPRRRTHFVRLPHSSS